MLNRRSIWSTVHYLPWIETLVAVERLYLFQPLVLSDVHAEASVSLALPVIDHFA